MLRGWTIKPEGDDDLSDVWYVLISYDNSWTWIVKDSLKAPHIFKAFERYSGVYLSYRSIVQKYPLSNPKRLEKKKHHPQKESQACQGPWPSRNHVEMFLVQVASVLWYQTCKTWENQEPSFDRLVLSGNLTWLDSYQKPPLHGNNHCHGETRHSSFSQHASSASKMANLGTFQLKWWPTNENPGRKKGEMRKRQIVVVIPDKEGIPALKYHCHLSGYMHPTSSYHFWKFIRLNFRRNQSLQAMQMWRNGHHHLPPLLPGVARGGSRLAQSAW